MSSSLSYSGSMAWNTGLDALESSSVRRYERSGVAKSGHVSLKQEIVMGESVVMQRPFRPSVEVSRRREAAVPSERPTETKGTDAPGETLSCLCSLEPSAFPGYLDATKRYGEEAKRDNKLFETVAIFREASSASKDGFRFAEVMADSGSTAAEGAAFRQSGTAFRTENVDQPSERCLPPTILESSATCTENTKTLTAEMCAVVERSCLRADASYGCGNSLSSSVFGPALVDTGRKIEEEIEQENRAQHDYGLFCEERQNASNEGLCSFGEDRECESETKGGTELSVSACWRRTTSPASSPDSGDFWDDLGDREATETTSPGERDVTEPSMEETDEEKQVEQSDKATEDTLECRVRENELKPKSEDQHHTGARRRFQLSNTECASPKVCQARIRHPEIAAKTLQRRWREHFMSAALEFEALVRCIRQIRSLAAVEVQRIYRGSRLRGILREEMHCLVLTLREEDIAQVNGERDACSEGPRGGRQGVRNVELVGAFGDRPWEERVSMRFCGVRRCYTAARPYTVGHHLFKFIVDGSYRCSGQYAQVADSAGNVNNCIDVADPVPPALCLAPRFPWPRARAFRCARPSTLRLPCGAFSGHEFPPVARSGDSRFPNDVDGGTLSRSSGQEERGVEAACKQQTSRKKNARGTAGEDTSFNGDTQNGGGDSPPRRSARDREPASGRGKGTEEDGEENARDAVFLQTFTVQAWRAQASIRTENRGQLSDALRRRDSPSWLVPLSETKPPLFLALASRHPDGCSHAAFRMGQEDEATREMCFLEKTLVGYENIADRKAAVSAAFSVRLHNGQAEAPHLSADLDDVVAPLLSFPRWSALSRRARHERSSRILPALWRTALTRKASGGFSCRRTGRSAASGGDSPLAEDAQNCGGSPSRSDGSQTASGAQRPPLSSAGAWSPTSGRSPSPRQVDPSAIGQADVGDTADEGDIEGAIPSCRLSTLDKESSSGLSRFRGCEAEGEPASDTCFETVLETARASKPFCSGNVQDARVTRGSLTCLAKKPLSHRTRHRQRDPRKRELSFATCPRRNPSAHPGETESHQPQQSRRSLVTGALVSFPPLYESGKGGSVHRESSAEAPQVPTLLSHPAVSARVAPLPGEARGRRQTTRRLAFEGPRSAPVVASGLDGGVASRTQGNGAARDRDESTGEAPNGDAGKTHTAKGSVPCGGSPLLLDALAASERDSLSLEAKYGSACTVRGECCPPEQDREESIKGGVSRGAIDRVTAKAGRGSGTSAEDTEGSNLQNEATPGEAGGACVCSSFDRVSFRTGVPKKHTSLSAPSISRLREKALRHREQVSSDLLVQGKEQFADAGLSAEVGSQPAGPEGVGASKRGGRHHPKRPADVCADLALSLVEGTCDRSRGNHGPNREGGTGAETSGKETLRGQEQGATEPFEVEEVKPVRRPCGRLPPLAFEKLLFTAALKIPEKCIHPAISHSIPIAWLRGVQEEPTRKVLCRVAALRGPTPSDSPHPRGMQELGGGR
uniref:AMP-activated protein kinase glycogen-binding domain-containing protein n=1 Tax=Neospora caninum (strain Liverpool) TaxID=572307 RepID=A0A0F7UAC3_NEOCL|nr:TPA: hypothetical protein BN1204_026330 [Neospora caninum Liverpool]